MNNEYEEVMSKRLDDELIDIVTINRDGYQPLAVIAAEKEIEKRGMSLNQFNQKIEQKERELIIKTSNDSIDFPIKILRSTKIKSSIGYTIASQYKNTRFDFIIEGNIGKIFVNGTFLGETEFENEIYTFVYSGVEDIKIRIWIKKNKSTKICNIGITIDGIPVENSLSDPSKRIKRAIFFGNIFIIFLLLIKLFQSIVADIEFQVYIIIFLISIQLISFVFYKKKSKIPLITGIIIGYIEFIDYFVAINYFMKITNYDVQLPILAFLALLILRSMNLGYMTSALKLYKKNAIFKL